MMKRWSILICLLFLFQTNYACAELDPETDRIGIYFDLENFYHCPVAYNEYMVVPAYIVLTNPTFPQIHGWEATLGIMGNPLILNVEFEGGGVNSGSDNEYRVLLENPLACEPTTLLATVNFYLTPEYTTCCLYLTGVDDPGLPGNLPVIWPEANLPVTLEPTKMFDNGVGAILGDCSVVIGYPHWCEMVVENEQAHWGTIKAFYR